MNKEIIPELEKFTLTFSRPQSVLRDEIAYVLFEKYVNIPRLRVMTIPLEGINRAIYVDSIFLKQLFDFLLNEIVTLDGWEQHLKCYMELVEEFKSVGQEIIDNTSFDKKVLLTLYKKGIKTIRDLGDYAWMPLPVEKTIVPKFIELLQEKHPADWKEINEAISSPVKLYGYQKMRLDICDAVINNKTNSEEYIQKLVDLHKYQGEYSYIEPLCDTPYFKEEFAKLNLEIALQEKTRINDEVKHNQLNLSQAMAKIKEEQLILWANIINEYTFLRTDRVDLLKKIQVSVRNILDMVAEHLTKDNGKTWTRVEVANLLNSEIIDYLESKFIPDLDYVLNRGKAVYYRTPDEVKIITDTIEVKKIQDTMNANLDKTIKGSVAFKGIVKGEVKMVFSKADLYKVLKGDILVARTTMPDYTPAMEIAGAFVTEEGGITSHAAIIARELKKPCIVGTRNCTKVLKDGDLVEVDAEKGIVRIINI